MYSRERARHECGMNAGEQHGRAHHAGVRGPDECNRWNTHTEHRSVLTQVPPTGPKMRGVQLFLKQTPVATSTSRVRTESIERLA